MSYKNLAAVLLVMTSCSMAQDALPTGKEVVAKYVKATGGKEAYAKIKSYSLRGRMEVRNGQAGRNKGDIIIKGLMAPRRQYQSVAMGADRIERFCTDKVAWETSGAGTRQIKGLEFVQAARDASFVPELTPEKFFKSMKVTGKVKVGDVECYKLSVVPKAGQPELFYYAIESGLKVRSEQSVAMRESVVKVETQYSDYRKVGEVSFPFKSTQKATQADKSTFFTLITDKIELNAKVSKTLFAVPDKFRPKTDGGASRGK